jgi:hypothetical protein
MVDLVTETALWSAADLDRLRRRAVEGPHAGAVAAARAAAEIAVASPLRPPDEPGGWGHDYFCPDHGARLDFDPGGPNEHRCPVDGREFKGGGFDAAWHNLANVAIVDGFRPTAVAFLATGEPRYAEHLTRTLQDYARRYPGWAPHGHWAGQGRAMGTSVEEATWAVNLVWGADAVRPALPRDVWAGIARNLLVPIGEHLLGQRLHRVHNIECWHLAALAGVGAVTGDERFLAPVLDEDDGLAAQLRGGVLDDGWWVEGSPTYHFYGLHALFASVVALRRRVDVPARFPQLGRMLTAPLVLLRRDLSLPALNDGWADVSRPGGIAIHGADLYAAGAGLWGDPAIGGLLARIRAQGASSPDGSVGRAEGLEALLLGPDAESAPPIEPVDGFCLVQRPSGYVVLRDGPADRQRWLLLKYGQHGGGHGHPDKLEIDLHVAGERLAIDPGSPGYSMPLHGAWYRHTLAHNTVVIGEVSQPRVSGRLRRLEIDGAVGLVEAGVEWPVGDAGSPRGPWLAEEPEGEPGLAAYGGASIRRCLLWRRDGQCPYFIDIVHVECPEPRSIDLAWHHLGAVVEPNELPAAPWDPPNATYAAITGTRRLDGPTWRVEWRVGGGGTRMWGLDPASATTLVGNAPSDPPSEPAAILLRRAHGRAARFVAVVEPNAGDAQVRQVRFDAAGSGLRVTVERRTSVDRWVLDPDERAVAVSSGSTGLAVSCGIG